MKRKSALFLLILFICSLTLAQDNKKPTIKVSNVFIDINHGDPIVFTKNFKKNEMVKKPYKFF